MAITKIELGSGRVRYIARRYKTDTKNSQSIRFDTEQEAENQIRDWKNTETRKKAKKVQTDCTREQNLFLYKGRR